VIAKNAGLRRIGPEAFLECCVLRSFYIPDSVEVICEACFRECTSLDRLEFDSGESFKTFVSGSMLDEALEKLGLNEISSLLEIEIDDGRICCDFSGRSSVADESSHLILIQDSA
jgi:hypothetical protein